MTIQSLLQNPQYSQKRVLENLICLVLEITREELRLKLDQDISEAKKYTILEYYRQYVEEKKPLEYIVGHMEFLDNVFFLDERSLIPRAETEYMIQAVNEELILLSSNQTREYTTYNKNILIDVGTGSGVLGLSVLLYNPDFFQQAYLLDYSQDALELAQKNYHHHNKDISSAVSLHHSDLLYYVTEHQCISSGDTVILLGNLPYIPDEMFEKNVGDGVKNWEPKMAFIGGDDGLVFYRRIFEQLFDERRSKDFETIMFLEMMTWQVEILEKEFGEKISFEEVKTFHFNIRIVKATLK